jgi:hypothetical protein
MPDRRFVASVELRLLLGREAAGLQPQLVVEQIGRGDGRCEQKRRERNGRR